MPRISVVIPAYNAEKTILNTLLSVQRQTFTDFEILVINDGSTDRTLEQVQQFPDPRLRVISYDNAGVSTARNRGIDQATGEFIAFLDADDQWTPDKLERQLAALQANPEADVAYSWTYFVRPHGQGWVCRAAKPVTWRGEVFANLLTEDFIYSGSNLLVRRAAIAAIQGFDPDLRACEDWECWLRLAQRSKFVPVEQYQIFYIRSQTSISNQVETLKQASLTAINKVFQIVPPDLHHLKSRCMVSFHLYCASLYLQNGVNRQQVHQAGRHLWQAICLHPALLLQSDTLRSIIKFGLMEILSPTTTNALLNRLAQFTPSAPSAPLRSSEETVPPASLLIS